MARRTEAEQPGRRSEAGDPVRGQCQPARQQGEDAGGTENEQLKTDLAKLQGDVATLQKQVGTPSDQAKRVAGARAENRTLKHRGEFAKLAKASGMREDAIETVFERAKYTPEDDEADPEKLQAIVDAAKTGQAWSFATETSATAAETKPAAPAAPVTKPIPGSGRGSPHQGKDGSAHHGRAARRPDVHAQPGEQGSHQPRSQGRPLPLTPVPITRSSRFSHN